MPVNRIFFFASYHPINASSRYRGLYLLKALQKQIGLKYYFIYPGYAPINLFYYTIALLRIAFTKSKKYRIVLQKVQGDIIWNTTGGVIYAKDAVFLNNRKDVAFLEYDRSHPNNYDYHKVAYKADFINCTFRRNDDYRIDIITPSITMNKVFAVNIKGCTFENTNSGTMANKGGAIYTIKATYKAGNNANGNPCHFEGYTNAIRSRGSKHDQIAPIDIEDATFKDNRHSIYLSGMKHGRIVGNTIDLDFQAQVVQNPGSDFQGLPIQNAHYGIYLDQCRLYQMHHNVMSMTNGQSQVNHLGVVVKNGGTTNEELFGNQIDGFTVGIEAIGKNKHPDDDMGGLTFTCNELGSSAAQGTSHGNTTDFLAVNGNGTLNGNEGVAKNQGNPSPTSAQDLPRNLFSVNPTLHLKNDANNGITYTHGSGAARLAPTKTQGNVTVNSVPIPANFQNDCGLRGKNGLSISQLQTDYTTVEAEIATKQNLYDQYVNGGNTLALEAQILFANSSQDYQDIYLELMSSAPGVTDDILLETALLPNYPELALRNIMVANPHSSRNPEIMNALYQKEPPLSQQTLTDIENEQHTFTAFDLLVAEMAALQRHSERVTAQLIDLWNDQISTADHLPAIRQHLKSRDEPAYRYSLVESYLDEGNVAQAGTELTAIGQELNLEPSQNAEYLSLQSYYNLVLEVVGDSEANLSQLPPDKINTLQNLEATGKGLAVVRARHLLALNGVETGYVEPVFFPGGTANKKDPSPAHPNRPALRSNHFRLNPNPARESVSLYWNFAEILSPTPLEVEILNLQGKVLQRWTIDNPRLEMEVLDISPLNTGAYILRVLQGENSLYHHKLLIE